MADPADLLSLVLQTDTVSINGRTYTSTYTAETRSFVTTTPEARQWEATIDDQGRVVEADPPGLLPTRLQYDDQGRLITVRQGNGEETRTVSLSYTSQNYLETVTDPLGREVRYEYDAAGRITTESLPGRRVVHHEYDKAGNVTGFIPPGRPTHSFGFSPVDLLTSYSAPPIGEEDSQTDYSYNLDRQLTEVLLPDGRVARVDYDDGGRLTSITLDRGALGFSYDSGGNLRFIGAPGGIGLTYSYDGSLVASETWSGPVAGRVSRTYDNTFRATSVTVDEGISIGVEHDDDGLITQAGALTISRDSGSGFITGTALGAITDSWTYNAFGEPTSYDVLEEGKPILQLQYERDALGRITRKTEVIESATDTYDYRYDDAGRLVGLRKNGDELVAYEYDINGNRISLTDRDGVITANYDDQDRMRQQGDTAYVYSADGALKSKTVGGATTLYEYDELGNLISVRLPDGKELTYLVDGRGRRVGELVNGQMERGFLYVDALHPVAELDAAGNFVSQFVYATGKNVPDFMVKGNDSYRIISDHLGSVRFVIDQSTGATVQRIDYDAFGHVIADSNPGFQPFGFAGGLYDSRTQLVRFGARDYDPDTGRWTSKDPAGLRGHHTNSYLYAVDDPNNFIDPNGSVAIAAAAPILLVPGLGQVILVGAAITLVIGGIVLVVQAVTEDEGSGATPATSPELTTAPNQCPAPAIPVDPTQSPGDPWEWRGKPPVGGDKGAWYNPGTGESLHPDLNHPAPIGPHWDYKDSTGKGWRIFPDGIKPK